jgi:hypothetical protein
MEKWLNHQLASGLPYFLPGMTVRWRDRRYVVVDCADFDTILGRELGKRRLHDIPIAEAEPDQIPDGRVPETPDLVSVPTNSCGWLARNSRRSNPCWRWIR